MDVKIHIHGNPELVKPRDILCILCIYLPFMVNKDFQYSVRNKSVQNACDYKNANYCQMLIQIHTSQTVLNANSLP